MQSLASLFLLKCILNHNCHLHGGMPATHALCRRENWRSRPALRELGRVIFYFQKIVTYRGHKKGMGTTRNTETFNRGQRSQVGQLFHTRSVMPYHGSPGLRDKRLSTHSGLHLLPKCLPRPIPSQNHLLYAHVTKRQAGLTVSTSVSLRPHQNPC